MPSLNDITKNRAQKKFKKRNYRPWDLDGTSSSANENSSPAETQVLDKIETPEKHSYEKIVSVPVESIKNWEFHDRPEEELGDISGLAQEFKEFGQHQPCIVRLSSDTNYTYELIAGERRWRAAKAAGVNLKVIAKELTDNQAAIVQASENSTRKDLSDYAKGMSYHRMIEKGVLEQKDLIEKLKISRQQVSRLLSFSKLPESVIESIKDFSKVKARMAEEIKQLCNKGDQYINAVIHYSEQIRVGEIGNNKLKQLVELFISSEDKTKKSPSRKVYSDNGRLLFTWRKEKDAYFSIHFPKDITHLIEDNKLDYKTMDNKLRDFMETMLKNI